MDRKNLKCIDALSGNVRKFRRALGMSQKDIAEYAHLSRPFVTCIELGKRNPSLGSVESMANAFGIEPWQLLRPYENSEIDRFCRSLRGLPIKNVDK